MTENDSYEPVRVAGIGLGDLGVQTLQVSEEYPFSTVVAGYDPFDAARETFRDIFDDVQAYDSLDTLLSEEDLDAAYITSVHTTHYEEAEQCLEHDVDVLVEKPMVTDTADAQNLVSQAQDNGNVLHVGLQRHLHPGYQKMRHLVDSGAIGRIEHVQAELQQPGWISSFQDAWRTDATYSGGGELYDSGQHLLDAVIWGTGSQPVAVDETDFTYIDDLYDLPDNDPADRNQVDADATFSLELASDDESYTFPAEINVYGSPQNGDRPPDGHDLEESITITGTDGVITFTNDGAEALAVYTDEGRDIAVEAYSPEEYGYEDMIQRKVDAFITAVRHNSMTPATGEDGLYVTAVTESAYESDMAEEPVDLSQYL